MSATAANIKQFPGTDPVHVEHDGKLAVSVGSSRFEKHWKNQEMRWSALVSRLKASIRTKETLAEYSAMSTTQKGDVKDVGGFVGGYVRKGRRLTGSVNERQIITLDADFLKEGETLDDKMLEIDELNVAFAVYSTHTNTPKKPKQRLVIPMTRIVSADEYGAISRKIADKIGIDLFDDSTYQPHRLMYWPSHCFDAEPYFYFFDAEFLDPDLILAEYPDWKDTSFWPYSSRTSKDQQHAMKKAGDPTEKPGLIGAFNRAYPIKEAIDTFLPDVYEACSAEDRYTFKNGSTAAGLIVYEDEGFAYSHHGTDPAGGQLCNAFDLVRIHKFGHLDEDEDPSKSITKMPSYKAMTEFARNDDGVKIAIAQEAKEKAAADFAEEETNWETQLELTKSGEIKPILKNAELIIQNRPELQGIRFNELSGVIEITGKLPWKRPRTKYWRDADDDMLYSHITQLYGVQFPNTVFVRALSVITNTRGYNPLQEYIQQLPEWDGIPRVDTLLIDYLGAEDTPYVRAVTRKTLIGAVNRVWNPGCKHDTVLVLNGKPGIGKSTLLAKLGGEWFSDNLSLTDTRDKTAAEKLQGVWIMEIGEMQGARKADVNAMKSFISRQVDEYRAAYGRIVEKHPRTAILCGTTNSTTGFLRDTTGNRRFWPVPVEGDGRLSVWDLDSATRDQIWAEAVLYASEGEEAFLDPEMEQEAVKMQQEALEYDERQGEVEEYLNTLLPEDWYGWTKERRIDYFRERDELEPELTGAIQRTMVCPMEIFLECFKRPENTWRHQDSYEIASIMARIPGWEKTGERCRIPGYGQQRPYTRKVVTK